MTLRFDWTRSAALAFAQLYTQRDSALLNGVSEQDLRLLYEFAVCVADRDLVERVSSAMRERGIALQIAHMLRIAIWPSKNKRRLTMEQVRLYVPLAAPTADEFVMAMAMASMKPRSFDDLLALCPRVPEMTQRDVQRIYDGVWQDCMLDSLKSSWLSEYAVAPPSKLAFSSNARLEYLKELGMSCWCYWLLDDREQGSDAAQTIDERYAPGAGIEFVRCMNYFLQKTQSLNDSSET